MAERGPLHHPRSVRARWREWEGDGRNLIAGTDGGTVGWNLARRQSFIPNQAPFSRTTSLVGGATAALVACVRRMSRACCWTARARGTAVVTRSLPQSLVRALKAAPPPAIRNVLADLDRR